MKTIVYTGARHRHDGVFGHENQGVVEEVGSASYQA
jgi:Zn-dependent alcohol dehydrogenase